MSTSVLHVHNVFRSSQIRFISSKIQIGKAVSGNKIFKVLISKVVKIVNMATIPTGLNKFGCIVFFCQM